MAGFYKRWSCMLLALTAFFLLLSHTLFLPSPPEPQVIRARRRPGLLLQQQPQQQQQQHELPPEPARQQGAAPPSAATDATTVRQEAPLGLMGGASAIGSEAASPYRPHGEEDTRCEPRRERALASRALDLVVPAETAEWPINCGGDNEELCAAVRAAAVNREIIVGVANSAVIGQLDKWIESNRLAGMSNMLVVAIDDKLPEWLASKGVACWPRPDKVRGSI